ncbi:MAG TPA: hypothetical protein VNZ64_18290 [Candidatus Acidoferrum sp.]|nr:hypothetical protein [Candidatus Acidoferrum sp.]
MDQELPGGFGGFLVILGPAAALQAQNTRRDPGIQVDFPEDQAFSVPLEGDVLILDQALKVQPFEMEIASGFLDAKGAVRHTWPVAPRAMPDIRP